MRAFIGRFPRFYAASPEFLDIQRALEAELQDLWTTWDDAMAQLCADTATWGLAYWEKTLGLPADVAASAEERRSRVRARLCSVGVTTVETVRTVAETFLGGSVEVEESAKEFLVDIRFFWDAGTLPDLRALIEALREIMPAHLSFSITPIAITGMPAYAAAVPIGCEMIDGAIAEYY